MTHSESRETARKHLSERWEYLGRMGWQGTLTRRGYIATNLRAVARNIADGLIPDGRGCYLNPRK